LRPGARPRRIEVQGTMMIFTNQDPSWLRAPVAHVILSTSEGSHRSMKNPVLDG
jgi:hypothetical protein